jgi:hemerythrin superfamily protein
MDVTKILEADHRQVEELFAKIEKADGDARKPLIGELTTALRGHMQLEESVVYPAMRPIVGDETVTEGTTEHRLVEKGLGDVERLGPDEPGFGAALDAVKAGVGHHVEEEETEVFPKLRKEGGSTLAEMATPFMKQRLALGLPVTVDGLSASATKDELVDEAESAGIEDATSMKKDELASALVDAMSGQ